MVGVGPYSGLGGLWLLADLPGRSGVHAFDSWLRSSGLVLFRVLEVG